MVLVPRRGSNERMNFPALHNFCHVHFGVETFTPKKSESRCVWCVQKMHKAESRISSRLCSLVYISLVVQPPCPSPSIFLSATSIVELARSNVLVQVLGVIMT
jgi:hypothetical protein